MIQLGYVELNLVRHCTRGCSACNHFSPVAKKWFMEPAEAARDLEKLSKVAHFYGCSAQGGEPLLHPKLLEFMDIIPRSGICDKPIVLTNGDLLDKMPDDFWRKLHEHSYELRLSWYPSLKEHIIPYATEKAKEYGVDFRPSAKFATFQKMITDHADGGAAVWKVCPYKRCYTVHHGRFYHCPISVFMITEFPDLFESGLDPLVDGYPLDELTEGRLREIVERREPLKSCKRCTGASDVPIPWSETRNREKWIQESTV